MSEWRNLARSVCYGSSKGPNHGSDATRLPEIRTDCRRIGWNRRRCLRAAGQAVGLVLSKVGMQGYNTFASTQIRVIAGIAGFSVLFTIMGFWKHAYRALSKRKPMLQLSLGAFFGPFLGVSFSLIAIKRFDDHRACNFVHRDPRIIGILHRATLRNRYACRWGQLVLTPERPSLL